MVVLVGPVTRSYWIKWKKARYNQGKRQRERERKKKQSRKSKSRIRCSYQLRNDNCLARLRDREARYQLSCRIMDSFRPSGFVSLSLISFDSPCLFSLRHLSLPSLFLLYDVSLFVPLNYVSISVYSSLSLFSLCSHATKASPTVLDNETVSRFVPLFSGNGGGRVKKTSKEWARKNVVRVREGRNTKREKVRIEPWHTQRVLSEYST